MANEEQKQAQGALLAVDRQQEARQQAEHSGTEATDGLRDKKPEDLTPEELRLMADTMPGDGPGD